jgi:hypothetical protein
MTTVFAIVLALITLVLFPILLRIVATLLEIAMFLGVAYALTSYAFPAWQLFSQQWWIAYAGVAVVCAASWMGLYVLMAYIQHPFRHGQWTVPANFDDAVSCRACDEDETVNTYVLDPLRRKVAALSPLTRTANELIASIRALPMFVLTFGASNGLIVYGLFTENPLWALAGGVVYGAIVSWQSAGQAHTAQTAILFFLGMTREEALQNAQALESSAVESEPDDADDDDYDGS